MHKISHLLLALNTNQYGSVKANYSKANSSGCIFQKDETQIRLKKLVVHIREVPKNFSKKGLQFKTSHHNPSLTS